MRALLAAVALLALLSACTQSRTVPDRYGDTTEENFMEGCLQMTEGDGPGRSFTSKEAKDVCGCAYDAIVKDIPFDEFKQLNEELEDEPAALPQEMLDIMATCVEDNAAPT